jgi:hypothetical protein
MVEIRSIEREVFRTDFRGGAHPDLHQEVEWFATASGRTRGVLILDLVDHDYSWVVLTREYQPDSYRGTGNADGAFAAVDLGHSAADQDVARKQLHAAMRKAEAAHA